jgi:two-component system cell cycle sensor histidine kinase/response regulator CckA
MRGSVMSQSLFKKSGIEEQKLRHKLLIIVVLIFILPFLVLSLILYQSNFAMEISHLTMYAINLVLVLAGFIILRQIFDIFHRMAMTFKKAEAGEKVAITIHEDVTELRDIATSFNNLMEKFENTAESLRVTRLNLESESTERAKAELALRESEARLKSLLASTEDIIIMQDHFGRILYYNAPIRYGLTEEEVVGKTLYDLFDSDIASRLMERIHQVMITLKSVTSEEQIVWKGETEWHLFLISPVIDDVTGQVSAVTIIARNITDRKSMEEEMLKVQKLESIGILAGGIAHDFNNLLTAILGYIDLAKMYLKPGDAAYEKLVSAEKASHRAKDLTQRLITFSRGGMPVKRTMTVTNLIKDTVHLALSDSEISCDLAISQDLCSVEVDEGQIRQVLQNLTVNAKEATPSGGTITIKAENITIAPEDGLPVSAGKYIRVSIQDRGSGIPKENLSKIFDPYFTTKEMGAQKGMGLGLSVCYSIIQRHGGCITVDSEEGKGTVFNVYLPVSEK